MTNDLPIIRERDPLWNFFASSEEANAGKNIVGSAAK